MIRDPQLLIIYSKNQPAKGKVYFILKILFFHRILYQQVYHEMRNIPSPNFLAVGLTLGPNG